MKHLFFLFVVFVFCSCNLIFAQGDAPARVNQQWLAGQDSTTQRQAHHLARTVRDGSLSRGGSLHIMPFSFINGFSRFRFGGQMKRERWSYLLDVEIGGDMTQRWVRNMDDRDYRFYGVRPEFRYEVDKYRPGLYVGLELPVTVLNRKISGRFETANGERRLVDEARQDRLRVSAIGKLGIQLLAGKHLLFDLYGGIGVAYREVRYSERMGEVIPENELFENLDFLSDLSEEGVQWIPDFALGVRVGWWFNANRRTN